MVKSAGVLVMRNKERETDFSQFSFMVASRWHYDPQLNNRAPPTFQTRRPELPQQLIEQANSTASYILKRNSSGVFIKTRTQNLQNTSTAS